MRILAFDTALAACSAALWQDGAVVARRAEAMSRGQSEALMPMVVAVMEEAGCAFRDLDRLAVTVGPGAFTGLRLGLAAARGLALALELPVVAVTTLEAVAHGLDRSARAGRRVVVALDGGRADLYLQVFDADLAGCGPVAALMPGDALGWMPQGPVIVAGNGAPRVRQALAAGPPGRAAEVRFADGPGLPDAAVVAAIAATREAAPAGDKAGAGPAPLYLHPPYAKLPARLGRR